MDDRPEKWDYRVARTRSGGDQIAWVDGLSPKLVGEEVQLAGVGQALKEWGDEGWELVTATPITDNRVEYILKKPTPR